MKQDIKSYVWWSIYVRTSTVAKLKEVHLPLIDAALESLEFDWQIGIEEESPGLYRLINYQNIETETIAEFTLIVLKRAYRLASSWSISGLGDLEAGHLKHIAGTWSIVKPSPRPPALESIVFEAQPGSISGMTPDGGWQVVEE